MSIIWEIDYDIEEENRLNEETFRKIQLLRSELAVHISVNEQRKGA